MPAAAETQQFAFQAEIQQLLSLLANSLYQSREIVLRELISNASDALDKMRHIALVEEGRLGPGDLRIELAADAKNRQLRVRDNGLGMTHEELVDNLGTIARSGSLEFLKNLAEEGDAGVSLIGQFGVGFYSSFMVADSVEVLTRSHKEEHGWRWESRGEGTFEIAPVEEPLERGTQVILHLKKKCRELAEADRVKEIVRRHSSFVQYPIVLEGQTLNDQKPIWVEPPSQLKDEDYDRFYQHLTHRVDENPLWRLHVSVDSPIQFHAVLFCPPRNLELLGLGRLEHGVSLCAKRILVQSDCRELLPDYLRFVCGLVDSEDLPLNVSRETLQDNTVFRKIRKTLLSQVLGKLESSAEQSPEEYEAFYRQFGPILREGVATDLGQRDRIAKLLRFPSSHGEADSLTSLAAYCERAPEGQRQIYYATGADRESILTNPNLEIFRRRQLETLYLSDPVDEFVLAGLQEYEGRRLVPVDSADVEIPAGAEEGGEATSGGELPGGFGRVVSLFREALREDVQDVRESKRLTDSPCCLVGAEGGVSAQLQQMMKLHNRDLPLPKRILELNPRAPLIEKLCSLSVNSEHDDFIRQCARQLYDNALLLEGLAPDPREMVTRVHRLMEQVAAGKSPIVA